MTAQELRSIASQLANSCFVRYWYHWNYPQNPTKMAIGIKDSMERFDQLDKELLAKGFEIELPNFCERLYIISRHNEDGTPYHSNLV